jgi:phage-related protein
VKRVVFLGDSLDAIRKFPDEAQDELGHQLWLVQIGDDPDDWKPMAAVGPGVREIRVREASGAFLLIYFAAFPDGVLVLHAFQKKTQKTPKRDIDLAAARLRAFRE